MREITVLKLIGYIEKKNIPVVHYTSQLVDVTTISQEERCKASITPIKVNGDNGVIFFENYTNGQVLGFFYSSIKDLESDLKKIRHIDADDISEYTRAVSEYSRFLALDRFTIAKGVKTLLAI